MRAHDGCTTCTKDMCLWAMKGKSRGLSLQNGASHTHTHIYTLKLCYSRIFILYNIYIYIYMKKLTDLLLLDKHTLSFNVHSIIVPLQLQIRSI